MQLQKDGETTELTYKFNKLKQKLHAGKELSSYLKKGWQLVEISGDDSNVEGMKRLLAGYKTGDPVPVKGLMRETGLRVLPGFLKNRLEKEEGSCVRKETEKEETRET